MVSYAAFMEHRLKNIIVVHFEIFCFILNWQTETNVENLCETHYSSWVCL